MFLYLVSGGFLMFLFPQKVYLEQPSAPTRLIQAEECWGGQPDAKVMF